MSLSAGKRQTADPRPILIPADEAEQRKLQRRAKAGEITRIAAGIYANAVDPADLPAGQFGPVAQLVRRHWQAILGHLVPGAVVSHLSALKGGITPADEVTLSHPTRFNTTLSMPGLSAVLIKGPAALPGDMPLGSSGLYWSSRPRMLLENLGRSRNSKPRRAGHAGVEEKLVEILNASGDAALNRVRDEARSLAEAMDATDDFATLNGMIGALLGTWATGSLRTPQGQRVAQGTPVDAERLHRFQILADALRTTSVPDLPDIAAQDPARTHFAFLESYFSNFVEGTRFSIEEAEAIALQNRIVPGRPKDSHDILGVFQLILHPHTRSSLPAPADILDALRERHLRMMENRPEVQPGEFKVQINYAGSTRFTEPAFVRGTLLEGAQLAGSVPEGLARAIYYAFLISEVHPFSDGNGRLARLLMNAELSRCGRSRIIIPTLYHEQYVDAQRALSRQNDPAPLIRALSYIARWTISFSCTDLHATIAALKAANAFEEDAREFKLLTPNTTQETP
jgi:hypothetical protein